MSEQNTNGPAPLTPEERQAHLTLRKAKEQAWADHAAVDGSDEAFVPAYTAYQEAREAHLQSLLALEDRFLATPSPTLEQRFQRVREEVEAYRTAARRGMRMEEMWAYDQVLNLLDREPEGGMK